MATQFESQGQLQEFLGILRKRAWQVILPAAVVVAIGTTFAVIVPKKFLARTQLELRSTETADITKQVKSAKYQITAIERIRRVIRDLKWVDFLALDAKYHTEYLRDVQDAIDVTATGGEETAFVTIEYMNVNPKKAGEFLKALRDEWIEDVIDRGRNLLLAQEQKLLERRRELAQSKQNEEGTLTELYQRHDISPTQPTPGSEQAGNGDPIFERLQENESALEAARRELLELETDAAKKGELYLSLPEVVPEVESVAGVSVDIEVQRLLKSISETREKRKSYRPAHSQHTVLTRELEELEERLRIIRGQETSTQLETHLVINPERAKMQREIDGLEQGSAVLQARIGSLEELSKVLKRESNEHAEAYREIRSGNDAIARLQESLTMLDEDYERVRQTLSRASGPGGNPFEITQEVATPRKPTEPNPILIIVFSIVGGLALGIGWTVVAEFSKSCFRSVNDISRVLVAPVLGSVNSIVTRTDVRRRSLRRLIVGASTLSVIGVLMFLTWAWAFNPDLLPQSVLRVIQDLRKNLQ